MTSTQQPDRSKAPAIGDFEPRRLPTADSRRLSNGIKRHCLHRGDYELVRLDIVCPTGTMEFAPSVAVLRGRMLKEGSKLFNGADIAEMLDFNGASVVSVPSNHHTVVSLTALRRNIHKVLPVFFDMLCNPLFPDREADAVKRQMITELQCNRETPAFNAHEELRRMISGRGHRYGLPESEAGIREISREMLQESHRYCIDPARITAYVAGFADDAILHEIDSRLEAIECYTHNTPTGIAPFRPEDAGVRRIQVDGSLQHAIVAAAPANITGPADPEYWPLRLAAHALGGYFGSRLMQNIREDKGYTYGIYAQLNCMNEGTFTAISCECDPSYTPAVLNEINDELRRFAANPMGADEHHRLRLSLASRLAGMCDTPMKVQAQLISQQINGQQPDYYDRFWRALAEVTAEQMSQAAAENLQIESLRTAIAGDFMQ